MHPANMSECNFEAWMDIDNNIPVTAKVTENDICDTVIFKQLEEMEENEIVTEISLLTIGEMRRALDSP